MTLFFIFIDGVGLGDGHLESNPVFATPHPFMDEILGSDDWEIGDREIHSSIADLYRLDATLGIKGLPQSATGQSVLLTGLNIPQIIGEHYGPKPDERISAFLRSGGIFGDFAKAGKKVALVNAYPKTYFDGIKSGKRLYSAFPLAITNAGFQLYGEEDLVNGFAISADVTGKAWTTLFNNPEIEICDPKQAGIKLAQNHCATDLAIFEFWLTDYAGHKRDHSSAMELIRLMDKFLSGIFSAMNSEDLILITSDHGNMEDLGTKHHTTNPVPLILVGSKSGREKFNGAKTLLDVAPGIRNVILS